MTETVVFDTLNVLASLVVFCIVAFKLAMHPDKFTWIERVGMGMLAAGCILTVGPITFKPSPFDDWSSVLMRFGAAVYFVGRLTRHQVNNWQMRRDALRGLKEHR